MITKENRYGQYIPCHKHKGHYENTTCPDKVITTCSCGSAITEREMSYQNYRRKINSEIIGEFRCKEHFVNKLLTI